MAEGPINYSGLLTQVDFSPLQQGLQLRNQKQAIQAQEQQRAAAVQLAENKFSAEQQEDAAYQQALGGYLSNPTPEALREIASRFPDHQDALQKGADAYTTGQRNDLLKTGFGVLGALSVGKTDLALNMVVERSDALQKGGINTDQTDTLKQLIRDGKIEEAKAYVSYAMSGLVGSDHVAGVMESLGVGKKAEDRAADNARADRTLDLRERQTDATIARGEAASSRAERAADRADRKAAGGGKGGSGGSGGGGGYEYRIGPDGKLQRRKR